MALRADGKVALTPGGDGKALLWETSTGKLLGSPLENNFQVSTACLSADAKVAVSCGGKGARLWKFAHVGGDPEQIAVWTQVITGMDADERGNARVLDADEWQKRRQKLRELGGPPLHLDRGDRVDGFISVQSTSSWSTTRAISLRDSLLGRVTTACNLSGSLPEVGAVSRQLDRRRNPFELIGQIARSQSRLESLEKPGEKKSAIQRL